MNSPFEYFRFFRSGSCFFSRDRARTAARAPHAAAFGAIMTAVVAVSPPPAAAAQPKEKDDEFVIEYFDITDGRIAFSYVTQSGEDIYLLDFFDLTVLPIVATKGVDQAPTFSPDGKKIAFHSDVSGNFDIYVANSDGTDLLQLTTSPDADKGPSWSPDGKKIVFYSNRGTPGTDIYIMDADGSKQTLVPTFESRKNMSPRWSPRGDELLIGTNTEWPGWDIIVYNLSTKDKKVITDGLSSYSRPSWHPDGGSFLFAFGSAEEVDIYRGVKGASMPQALITRPGQDLDPVYDHQGQRIFFSAEETPGAKDFKLYLFDPSGLKAKPGTEKLVEENKPYIRILKSRGSVRYPSWTGVPSLASVKKRGGVIPSAPTSPPIVPRIPGPATGPGVGKTPAEIVIPPEMR